MQLLKVSLIRKKVEIKQKQVDLSKNYLTAQTTCKSESKKAFKQDDDMASNNFQENTQKKAVQVNKKQNFNFRIKPDSFILDGRQLQCMVAQIKKQFDEILGEQ